VVLIAAWLRRGTRHGTVAIPAGEGSPNSAAPPPRRPVLAAAHPEGAARG
jgi:hypothetical protein